MVIYRWSWAVSIQKKKNHFANKYSCHQSFGRKTTLWRCKKVTWSIPSNARTRGHDVSKLPMECHRWPKRFQSLKKHKFNVSNVWIYVTGWLFLSHFRQLLKQAPCFETDPDVTNYLMWSHFKIPFAKANSLKTTSYCYHSINVITFDHAQSNHIEQLLLCMDFPNSYFSFTSACIQIDLNELICADIFVFQSEPAECFLDHLLRGDRTRYRNG